MAGLYDCFSRLLNIAPQAHNTYLPYSMKDLSCPQELFLLVFKLLDTNPHFASHLARQQDLVVLLRPLLHFLWLCKNSPSRMGLLYA